MCNNHYKSPNKAITDNGHQDEHRTWSRRAFMQAMGIAGTGTLMLGSNMITASSGSPLNAAISGAETDNILILIRLAGGNDGLNTVIPISQYDTYRNERPNIYIPESKILKLTDDFGVPSYMKSVQGLWDSGGMKAVHGVGYESHNLSHFSSSDIYANTEISAANPFHRLDTGWMGRHFEDCYPNFLLDPPPAPAAVQIGSYGNLTFEGEKTNYAFVTSNVNQLKTIAETGGQFDTRTIDETCMYGDQLKFLRDVSNMSIEYSGVIHEAYERGKNEVAYQDNYFAEQMALIARLIKGNLGTKVFMVSMGGFDTHGNQPIAHERLMSNLSVAIKDFYEDLAFQQLDDKVLSMTFSEFGRRIGENGSFGTDHGTAAPTLFFGNGLNGSAFVGEHPKLDDPDRGGNLKYTQDFRDLYATVMAEWLCIDPALVSQHLLGKPYTPVDLGFNCSGFVFPEEPEVEQTVIHMPIHGPGVTDPLVHLELKTAAPQVEIVLFNLLGQNIGTIYSGEVGTRAKQFNVKDRIKKRLAIGQYIYRIEIEGQMFSKSIQIA